MVVGPFANFLLSLSALSLVWSRTSLGISQDLWGPHLTLRLCSVSGSTWNAGLGGGASAVGGCGAIGGSADDSDGQVAPARLCLHHLFAFLHFLFSYL